LPSCPNGHEQRLGFKCATCGAEVSFKESVGELLVLPRVNPDFGKMAVLTVAYPGLNIKTDYFGEISSAAEDQRTSTSFQAATIRGGTWLDYQNKYLKDLRRWMALVGVAKARDRLLLVDMTSPISVAAIAALPKIEHTAIIGVTADRESTPLEQNTSYVALSLAMKKGFPVIGITESFEREMLYFTEDKGFAAGPHAMSRLLDPLVAGMEDVMDLLEKDLRLGVKLHALSAIMAGSKTVYGIATNAFMAQSYNFSMGTKLEENQTLHTVVFSSRSTETEFEKSFGVFRNRRFKGALNAELRFHETESPVYDLLTFCGMRGDVSLQSIASGYQAIVRNVPELTVEGAY